MARCRVYLHPLRWTSLGLALLEAMHLGMPVVALATTEAPRAVPPEAGAISTDVDELRPCRPPAPATRRRPAGAAPSPGEAALARYGLRAFLDDWDALLERAGTDATAPDRTGYEPIPCRREKGEPVKISMVSEHASPLAALGGVDAGGQNVHVAALSAALAGAGTASRCTPGGTRTDLPGRVRMQPAAGGGPRRRRPAAPRAQGRTAALHGRAGRRACQRDWGRRPPDVVHGAFLDVGPGRPRRGRAGARRRPPMPVVRPSTRWAPSSAGTRARRTPARPSARWLEPAVGRAADRIIATCSDEVFELKAMGIDAGKVSIAPCGVDLELFSADGAGRPSATGRHRILSVGRLVPAQGRGPGDPGPAAAGGGGLRRRRTPHGRRRRRATGCCTRTRKSAGCWPSPGSWAWPEQVTLRGQVPRERHAGHLPQRGRRGVHALVRAVRHRPARSHGLRRAGGGRRRRRAPDTVVDHGTGLHVPPRDPEAIADALAGLLANPELRAELGSAGQARARPGIPGTGSPRKPRRPIQTGQLRRQRPRPARSPWKGQRCERRMAPTRSRTYRRRRSRPHWPAQAAGGTGTASAAAAATRTPAATPSSAHLDKSLPALESLRAQSGRLAAWGEELARRLLAGQRLLAAGNGGSAAEAQHLTAELVGRFDGERVPFSAISLHAETSAVTAIANDYGYEEVFARQVRAHGRSGDVLLLLSTSGKSPNLLRAVEAAARHWRHHVGADRPRAQSAGHQPATRRSPIDGPQRQRAGGPPDCPACHLPGLRRRGRRQRPGASRTDARQGVLAMRIVVVGDVLLDVDLDGEATRLSPDAPVPVVDVPASKRRAGGAGLVARMLAGDGRPVTPGDGTGRRRRRRGCLRRARRHRRGGRPRALPTPVKTRVRAGRPAGGPVRRGLRRRSGPDVTPAMLRAVEEADAIIVADYGRGLALEPALRELLARLARRRSRRLGPAPGRAPIPCPASPS